MPRLKYKDKETGEFKDLHGNVIGTPVVDNLNSTETRKALSANMGRELNDKINLTENKIPKVVDNLINKDITAALSGKQGKVLKDIIGNWGNTEALEDYECDLNDIDQTSFKVINKATINNPLGMSGYVFTLVKNPDYYILQIVISRDVSKPIIYMRTKSGSINWNSWIQVTNFGKETYSNLKGSDAIYYTQFRNLELGGIYEVSVVYCYNTNGSNNYRSVIYGILSIPCGYDKTAGKVTVMPKFNAISNYTGPGSTADSNLKIVCEGGGSTVEVSKFLELPQLCLYYTNYTYIKVLKVNIRKISV